MILISKIYETKRYIYLSIYIFGREYGDTFRPAELKDGKITVKKNGKACLLRQHK